MIPRTTLPNLASQFAKQRVTLHQMERMRLSESDYQPRRENQISGRYSTQKKNHSKLNKLHTQPNFNSQNITLEMKFFDNPDIFHIKAKSVKQQNSVVPYFFKIHNSLKILQSNDDLKRKLTQVRKQETQRLRTASIEQQKKKSQRRLISSPSKNATQSVGNLTNRKHNNDTLLHEPESLPNSKNHQPNNNTHVRPSNQLQLTSRSSTLKHRKHQLTQNAKQAKYTFEHFNSGQIFAEIALINQNKLSVYEKPQYGKIYSLKDKRKNYRLKKQMEENFREEYNTFLRNKLPPSFGQNGNKSCIYQEYVLKRKQEEKRAIQSKLVQGKFLKTEPTPTQHQEFIFTNEIGLLSEKKIKMEKAFAQKLSLQQTKMTNKLISDQNQRQDISVTTSKPQTRTNTKLNTLRQGQAFLNKLKLKKLAKMQLQEKDRSRTLNKHKSLLKSRSHSRGGGSSSLSDYENTLSQAEMRKLLQKSNLILGKVSPAIVVVNPEILSSSIIDNKNEIRKLPHNHSQNNQLNEYQQQHLSNIDRLLCKQQTILRKDKQDLDCLPWRISINVQRQRIL